MSSLLYQKMHKRIENSLLDNSFLNATSVDKKDVRSFTSSAQFSEKLKEIVSNDDYSCKAVLYLCSDMMNKICESNQPDDWLQYIYEFTLNMSFPNAVTIKLNTSYNKAALFYLQVLKVIIEYGKIYSNSQYFYKYPLLFLSTEEEKATNYPNEYRKFKRTYQSNYVYEMMMLNKEITEHNTLDHISGVHFLALHIGRQLHKLGLPVDLGRVSGAAAGHDIGKYGCTGNELKRVPYLHYYYTDIWYKKFDLQYIGHIATHHSTWDLELENLPIESLILIYSDFRVKNKILNNGKREMEIYSLKDSFEIILNKLDNVDSKKEKRYRRVYSKLKDFEDYMKNIGVNVELSDIKPIENKEKYFSLMHGQNVINNIKYLAIKHNILLMDKLKSEASLNAILEKALSERDWKKLRGYLNIFEEYSTYLTQKQKLITINFLYEFLTHSEEDIRKQCANLIGTLISAFDEEYRKEVPNDVILDSPDITSYSLFDKYLEMFLYPDHKIIEIHREWIGYSLSNMVSSLFKSSNKEQNHGYVNILYKYYSKMQNSEEINIVYLLQTIKYIPMGCYRNDSLDIPLNFILKKLYSDNLDFRILALESLDSLIHFIDKESAYYDKITLLLSKENFYSDNAAENFLKYKIVNKLEINSNLRTVALNCYMMDKQKTSDIFLKNLKTATSWTVKNVNIDFLLEQALNNPNKYGLHTAMHYCNLIKVSATENVRTHAGEALIKLFPLLSFDERNDVTVELLRALEMQGYQFTKYIPPYLGKIMLYLHPVELNEILDDFIDKIKLSSSQINFLLLKTIGSTIQNYAEYKNRFSEEDSVYYNRLSKMLGILLNGLVNYDEQVNQEAFSVIGKEVLGSRKLSLVQKNEIFQLIAKKILTLMAKSEENELVFLNNSASLNHIYRFISDFVFFYGKIDLRSNSKIAFFPGTFDPFSLGHKEIAREIQNLGFEVYLAVDEFSWSKRTQPHKLRREIINMSIADELNVHIFPEDIQINIANEKCLKTLKSIFPYSEVYIVVGSDVVLNASSYKREKTKDSIHSFPHIIFERRSSSYTENDDLMFERAIKNIDGDIVRLSLAPQYEDISSTQIRTYIDENRDISQLIDPLAQKYIYEYGIYKKEPQYKTLLKTKFINIEVIENIDEQTIDSIISQFLGDTKEAIESLKTVITKLNPRIILIRDIKNNNRILGFSIFHWIRTSMLFSQFGDQNISEYIRENSVGRIVLIDGIFANNSAENYNIYQILLTETLTFCLAKDYTYAVYRNIINYNVSEFVYEILELHGFQKVPRSNIKNPVFAVNMTKPTTLNLDIETIIKEPFVSNPNVKKAILRSRRRLQWALTKLYPGHLVLSFDMEMLYETLIEKICNINNVPTEHSIPRKLGENVCVPFGSILKGHIVPNTITKSMHTEKLFAPDIKSFTIGAYPYYMSIDNQASMINSFNRPIILIDDLLHNGYRIKAIDPILKKENVKVKKIVVGILSGRGKELMDIQNRDIESAYFIPNLRLWFNEKLMYPFIGGDTVWRGSYPYRNLIPSINLIMPYTSPSFIKDVTTDSIYNLSEICIVNAIDILSTLEKEYQTTNERTFTIKQLSEVFISPRCPDHGKNIKYDLNLKPSEYLINDLEHLKRVEDIIKR